jgi:hypothetical protein
LLSQYNSEKGGNITRGILSNAASVLGRIAFRFEILFPQFAGFVINRKLKKYKNRGLLEEYCVKSQ